MSKNLLLLGGGSWYKEIEKIAKKYSITLHALGNGKSPIFRISNKVKILENVDEFEIKSYIKKNKIDGVYMGGNEKLIYEVSDVLRDLGLPVYYTKNQLDNLHNKLNFKELCQSFNLPVVKKYDAGCYNSLSFCNYPVITKPVDGSGSSGFSICNNRKELEDGIRKAKNSSISKEVIVEDYVNNSSIVVFYDINNGNIECVGIEDKQSIQYKNQQSFVARLLTFQSKYKNQFIESYDKQVKEMIQYLDVRHGTIWMEVFCDGNQFFFNEAGYRFGGTMSFFPINYLTGINQVEKEILFALTGSSYVSDPTYMFERQLQPYQKYSIYCLHCDSGKITDIAGLDQLENTKNIVKVILFKNVGDVINDTGTYNQVFGVVHFIHEDEKELNGIIKTIHNILKINSNGINLLKK